MNRQDVVRAALAADSDQADFSPAQVQKLFFLIDREVASRIDGPIFNFQAYDYGPFDKDVYSAIELLVDQGEAIVSNSGRYRRYQLTEAGHKIGEDVLSAMDGVSKQFFIDAAKWVRSLTFQQMVSAIYKRYPEMKERSIFRDTAG